MRTPQLLLVTMVWSCLVAIFVNRDEITYTAHRDLKTSSKGKNLYHKKKRRRARRHKAHSLHRHATPFLRHLRAEPLEERLPLAMIGVPSTTNGDLQFPGELDSYTFDGVVGSLYAITYTPQSLPETQFTVKDGSGNVLESYQLINSSRTISVRPFANDTYEIIVGGDANVGAYSLALSATTYVDDHGSSSEFATPVSVPGLAAGQIDFKGDNDFFSFAAVAGTRYNIAPTNDIIMSISLFDTDGRTPMGSASSSRDQSSSVLSLLAPNDGVYFVAISGLSPLAEYTMNFFIAVDDFGSSRLEAEPLSIPSVIEGNVDFSGDSDHFSFQALMGNVYHFSLTATGDADLWWVLSDTTGVGIFSETGTSLDASWLAPANGTYSWAVRTFPGNQIEGYSLSSMRIDYEDDYGNGPEGATALSAPSSIPGIIEVAADQDWFSFTATAGTVYEITADPGAVSETKLRLFDTDGQTILEEDFGDGPDGASQIGWPATADGTYFFAVEASNDADTGDYTLSIASLVYGDDHGNLILSASPIGVPSATAGVVEVYGDVDVFSFTANTGTIYHFTVDAELPNSTDLLLYNATGEEISGERAALSFLGWQATTNGTHYVVVQGNSDRNQTPAYSLTVDTVLDDHGDSLELATLVSASSTPGIIDFDHDHDFFEFTTVAGTLYEISARLNTGALLDLKVYDAAFNPIGVATPPFRILGKRLGWVAPDNATYFVSIYSARRNVYGAYTLEINAPTYEDDHGNLATASTPISIPSITSGDIEIEGDVDYFSFSATEGTLYHFSFSVGRDARMDVLDADGAAVLATATGNSLKSRMVGWVAPADGIFYIKVGGRFVGETGDYRLKATIIGGPMRCDVVAVGNGCDTDDLDSLYTGTPTSLTDSRIAEWLAQASLAVNPAKQERSDVYVYGDVNLDGAVTNVDLGILLNSFGDSTGLPWSSGNLNADSSIDAADLGLLLNNFDFTSPTENDRLPCDYVSVGNGCNAADLDAFYPWIQGANQSVALMRQWLEQASDQDNPAKSNPTDVYVFGDVNLDGDVTSVDLGILLNNFDNVDEPDWRGGDLNADGVVDSVDLGLQLNNFGHASPSSLATLASANLSILDLVFGDSEEDE